MDFITNLDISLIIFGMIFLIIETIYTVNMCKGEFVEYLHLKKHVNKNIQIINEATNLIDKNYKVYKVRPNVAYKMNGRRKRKIISFKTILLNYCNSLVSSLEELYPGFNFNVSIKKISNDYVYTVVANNENVLLDSSKQLLIENTEYVSIIYEGNSYFFVTDLNFFDMKKQKYLSSDISWRNKYNTSIVFPIKRSKTKKNEIIGFICINSPQKLEKKKKNEFIIKLIEKTTYNISNILLKL